MTQSIVGGGPKKILYTLSTLRKIGVRKSARALNSRNTCKACGLGMGGQQGGMTNELGEFPSVCNKSVQAQSTDIQPPIPKDIFTHELSEFQKLSGQELESLGRLDTPLFKAANAKQFKVIQWAEALDLAVEAFSKTEPDRTFFYASGRASNEAGFVLQLLARLYGTNNVNNCSYYCHQATGVGLSATLGTGTATIGLADLKHSDFIFVIGANPASNHPRFVHQLKACRDRGGEVVVINPAKEPGLVRFAVPKSPKSLISGGTWIASDYLQPNIGSDLYVMTGLAKAILELGAEDNEFIVENCQGFSGYEHAVRQIDWDEISLKTGLSKTDIVRVAKRYANAKRVVFAWGMGITHHRCGVENVEAIASLALLRGMVGKPGAGMLPLRGHSNVQGIGTVGVKPELAMPVLENLRRTLGIALPTTPGLDTLACLHAAAEGRMDAALLMGGNLYEASPDSNWTSAALDRIEFKLCLTTTLNRGHVFGHDHSAVLVLPVTARDEEWQSTTQESMFNFVRLSDGGIRRLAQARPESHILCALGKRLVPAERFDFNQLEDHQAVRRIIAENVPGMSALADLGESRAEFHIEGRLLHSPNFALPQGKAKFCAPVFLGNALTCSDYPFRLMSVRSEGQFNSIIYEAKDSYRGTNDRWSVLLSPADMQRVGLKAGDLVTLRSAHGCMQALRAVSFDLPVGNVMVYYPEANVLIGREADPRSHTPAFKSVAVAIELV